MLLEATKLKSPMGLREGRLGGPPACPETGSRPMTLIATKYEQVCHARRNMAGANSPAPCLWFAEDDKRNKATDLDTETPPSLVRWPMLPYPFKPLKHNPIVAGLARRLFRLRARGLERFIFTATTGRSGTLTLTRLFASVPGCHAVHEAHPVMNGSLLRAASYGDHEIVERVYRRVKSVNIYRAAMRQRYYFEANHLFIKTFARNAVAEFGERIAVVHLVRPAVEVANSIYSLHDYPGTEQGNYWWLDFKAPTNVIEIADILSSDPEFSHPFYKALWYWHEIEARVALWRASVPAVKVIDFETRWLNDPERVCCLMEQLGLQYDKNRLAALIGVREHTKESQKIRAALRAEEAKDRAYRFRQLLERLQKRI